MSVCSTTRLTSRVASLLTAVLLSVLFSLSFEVDAHSHAEQNYSIDCFQCQLDNTPVAAHSINKVSGEAPVAEAGAEPVSLSPSAPYNRRSARGPPTFSC